MFPVTVSIDHVVIIEEVVTCVPVTDIIMLLYRRRLLHVFSVTFIIDHVVIKEEAVSCVSCYSFN